MNFTNFSFNTQADPLQPRVITTEDILAICGSFDSNALFASFFGLFVSLVFMFYLGRFRRGLSVGYRSFFDKLGLVVVSLMFVVIIVRLLRAG